MTLETFFGEIWCFLFTQTTKKRKYTGTIGHDPNIGQLPLIAKTLRTLGWKKDIIITDHRILPKNLHEEYKFVALQAYLFYLFGRKGTIEKI